MNIVINIGSAAEQSYREQQHFAAGYILKIAATQTEHSFFLITGDSKNSFLNTAGYRVIAAGPKQKNLLLRKIWYAYKLPALLKKYNAEVFINLDVACCVKTTTPQCLVLPDISFLQPLSSTKKIPVLFENAAMIITFAQFTKNTICKQYPKIPPEKVAVMYSSASPFFLPAEQEEKEETKKKYTDEKEYFLFTGEPSSINNCINLLKAFSFFKRRQKSNMQLIIASKSVSSNNPFIESLKTFKYRNDVKLIWEVEEEELAKITAAAYAFIYATALDNFYAPVLQAMQCGVPVVVSNTLVMNEICGEAALFADPTIFENIADKMMLVFKDEQLRNDFITKGKIQAAKFSINLNNQLLWQHIIKCAGITT